MRDLIGYGRHPPHANWPNGAQLALNFVLNFEEGSEPSYELGDARSETALTELGTSASDVKGRDLAAETMYEYGTRVGFWRVYDVFRERHIPLTIFACALALEKHPPATSAIAEADFDVCCHGWRWEKHYELDEDTERDHIRRAVESLSRTVGSRPLGWYCRYSPSTNTRRLLVEEGGFLYDSDAYNDDLPYWVTVSGRPHLVVPYTLANNDAKFVRGGFATSDDFFGFLKDAFDVLYREGETRPRVMSIGLHLRLIGHPGRSAGLMRFLDYVQGHDKVWIARRIDIARHWIAQHPYEAQRG